jgi:hypothetical protein
MKSLTENDIVVGCLKRVKAAELISVECKVLVNKMESQLAVKDRLIADQSDIILAQKIALEGRTVSCVCGGENKKNALYDLDAWRAERSS